VSDREWSLASLFCEHVWAPVPKQEGISANCGRGPRCDRAAIKGCNSEQTALLRWPVGGPLIALHTREVAGSKPAAPIARKVRYSRRSAWTAMASFWPNDPALVRETELVLT
jgi:hypothetical protein